MTPSDLVGTWDCTAYQTPIEPLDCIEDWVTSNNSLYRALSDAAIIFSDDDEGTFSFSTSAPDPFYCLRSESLTSEYDIIADQFFYNFQSVLGATGVGHYFLQRKSKDRIIFRKGGGSSYSSELIICDKQNLPPAAPTNLSASIAGLTVTLTWKDNSNNETGFKIIRKDSLKGNWGEVGNTPENSTTYVETVSAAGKYWYRVKATNDNGDSLGSNVVKVTISD